jgi:hypothetical protein
MVLRAERRSTEDRGDIVRLEIRTERVRFLVSKAPEPRSDGDGRQKVDRASGESLYSTELVAMDDTGAEVVKVTTAGAPKVAADQMVQVSGLVALPWSMEGRSGVAFRAQAIAPVKAGA